MLAPLVTQVCHDSNDQALLRRGLALVNTTQISVFNTNQRAELFRIKARLHDKFGPQFASQAHASFSYSLQVMPSYNKGWLSWGAFLDKYVDVLPGAEQFNLRLSSCTSLCQQMLTWYPARVDVQSTALTASPARWLLIHDCPLYRRPCRLFMASIKAADGGASIPQDLVANVMPADESAPRPSAPMAVAAQAIVCYMQVCWPFPQNLQSSSLEPHVSFVSHSLALCQIV